MKIMKQGSVRVNEYAIIYQNDDIVCLELDLRSKYVDTPVYGVLNETGINYPVLYLGANDIPLYLDETKLRGSVTEVFFDEFPGWDIFCMDGPYRYTVRLVLLRKHDVVH